MIIYIRRMAPFAALLALFASSARGAGYEFEGVGARQVSRGGAAIADADDWTAIYWNPANVARKRSSDIGVEIFTGEAFGRDPNSMNKLAGSIFTKDELHSNFILGAVGATLPIGEKGGIGFGFYTPLLQGADFSAIGTNANQTVIDLENAAAILTWNLSGAYQFNDRFSGGVGLNLLYGRLISDIKINNYQLPGDRLSNDIDGDGFGLEGMFGVRYEATEKISLGAVYRTGSDVDLEGDASSDYTAPLPLVLNQRSSFHYDLRHPPTWGVGAALRPSQRWTFTLDYNRTLWHRFVSNIRYDNPATFLPNLPNTFDWKDTYKVRLGGRCKLSANNELIAGYSYEEPALDSGSIDFSTAIDVYMNRLSFGYAHAWNERVETTLGVVAGYGERDISNQTYRLSGYQVMLETRFGSL